MTQEIFPGAQKHVLDELIKRNQVEAGESEKIRFWKRAMEIVAEDYRLLSTPYIARPFKDLGKFLNDTGISRSDILLVLNNPFKDDVEEELRFVNFGGRQSSVTMSLVWDISLETTHGIYSSGRFLKWNEISVNTRRKGQGNFSGLVLNEEIETDLSRDGILNAINIAASSPVKRIEGQIGRPYMTQYAFPIQGPSYVETKGKMILAQFNQGVSILPEQK